MNKQLDLLLKKNPYFRKDEGAMLCELLSKLPKNPRILEIGTFRGWSAILMAKARGDAVIITIDPHFGIPEDDLSSSAEEVSNNISRENLTYNILHLQISSQDFIPEQYTFRGNVDKFDLLFIDGDHTFAGVQHDFEKFLLYVKPEGIILFHDFGHLPGVTEFCKTLKFKTSQRFKSMLAIRKCNLC